MVRWDPYSDTVIHPDEKLTTSRNLIEVVVWMKQLTGGLINSYILVFIEKPVH